MFAKITSMVLGIVMLFSTYNIYESIDKYDTTELVNGLEEIYNLETLYDDKFDVAYLDSDNGCIDHNHNFYTVHTWYDSESRFVIESIADRGKIDKVKLSDNVIPCYGVAKACNVINDEMEDKLDVLGIIPTEVHMLFGTEYNIDDLKNGKYLSEPATFINSVKNAEYNATYFYDIESDKDAIFREVIRNIEELDINDYNITIAFVTGEEYKMFATKFRYYESVYVRDEQYGISARNCVFILSKSEGKIKLYSPVDYKNIDISNWVE